MSRRVLTPAAEEEKEEEVEVIGDNGLVDLLEKSVVHDE